jgi:CHRD domain
MKVRLVFVGLIASLTAFVSLTTAALAGADGSDSAAMCVLNTRLLPENEVRTTPNTSVASGHAQVKVRNDGTIEFKTFVLNPAGEVFNRAHIHGPADATANAGIRVDFLEAGVPVASLTGKTITFMGEGMVRAGNPDIGALMCARPDLYYVNFHSTAEPGGAIRGQLG